MKRKILTLCVIFFTIQFYIPLLKGQQTTSDLLKQKYWNYRERLKKYFIHIGLNQGESLILHQYNTAKQGSIPVCVGPNNERGHLKFGDVPEAQGMYMASLALEYRLLKDEGKDVTAVLNELYYLINAVNRLDNQASEHVRK